MVSNIQQRERCQNLGKLFWAQWGILNIFLQSRICVRNRLHLVKKPVTKSLKSHLNHTFSWLEPWGYLGIHWNIFYGLPGLLLKSCTAGGVRLMLRAERHAHSLPGWEFLGPHSLQRCLFLLLLIYCRSVKSCLILTFFISFIGLIRMIFEEMLLSSQPHPLPAYTI